jgi:hypothetical protein
MVIVDTIQRVGWRGICCHPNAKRQTQEKPSGITRLEASAKLKLRLLRHGEEFDRPRMNRVFCHHMPHRKTVRPAADPRARIVHRCLVENADERTPVHSGMDQAGPATSQCCCPNLLWPVMRRLVCHGWRSGSAVDKPGRPWTPDLHDETTCREVRGLVVTAQRGC